jgi:hypothetical protein
MKEAENNEIALLLKSMGKRKTVEPGSGATSVTSKHLDADELSSFAEGVLPPATRALYASHLADCDECRRVVAKLALASGTAVQSKTQTAAAFSLWHYLGGIFSPKVMRIAVPVLSLVIIAAVAFMWSRRDQPEFSVAQTAKPSTVAPGDVARDGQSTQADHDVAPSAKQIEAERQKPAANKAGEETAGAGPAKGAGETALADSPVPAKGVETKTAEAGSSDRVASASPAPPPAAETVTVTQPASKARGDAAKPEPTVTETAAKGEKDKKEDQAQKETKREEQAKNEAKKAADEQETRGARGRTGGFAGLMGGGSSAERRQVGTKSIGGRQFVRQDNRWVDTEYKQSALINVARGSEQYRALIGDEPGLRTIAEQLDGEVIVVWKGKAYRIK